MGIDVSIEPGAITGRLIKEMQTRLLNVFDDEMEVTKRRFEDRLKKELGHIALGMFSYYADKNTEDPLGSAFQSLAEQEEKTRLKWRSNSKMYLLDGVQLNEEVMQRFLSDAPLIPNYIKVTKGSPQAGFVFRQQEPWLVIGAPWSGAEFKFDEEEMRRRLAEGLGKNGVEAIEYRTMTAIAAVLDHERERAARINKTEL